MELDDTEDTRMMHRKIIVTIRYFSNDLIHSNRELSEVSTDYSELTDVNYLLERYGSYSTSVVTVFADGMKETDRGYVSVLIRYEYSSTFEIGCCIISVIDANKDHRFTRTFAFSPDTLDVAYDFETFSIDRYISREILLDHSDDLLPNNALTLMVEVYLLDDRYKHQKAVPEYEDVYEKSVQLVEDHSFKLFLDSPLAKCLAEYSTYFERMLDTPMRERDTKVLLLDVDESQPFKRIGKILMDDNVYFDSLEDILNTYIIANKYDIPAVTETCTCFLKLCLVDHTVDEYFKLANEYENEGWKELIMHEINLVKESNLDEEIEKLSNNSACLKLPFRGRLWRYIHTLDLDDLWFEDTVKGSRSKDEDVVICPESENFDFYR